MLFFARQGRHGGVVADWDLEAKAREMRRSHSCKGCCLHFFQCGSLGRVVNSCGRVGSPLLRKEDWSTYVTFWYMLLIVHGSQSMPDPAGQGVYVVDLREAKLLILFS